MCDEIEEKTNEMAEDVKFVEEEKWKKNEKKQIKTKRMLEKNIFENLKKILNNK